MNIPHASSTSPTSREVLLLGDADAQALRPVLGDHSMKEQRPDEVVALAAKYEVMFLPPPPHELRRGLVHLLAREARGRGIARTIALRSSNDSTSSMLLKPSGRAPSTASITPSGPPVRFIRTICAASAGVLLYIKRVRGMLALAAVGEAAGIEDRLRCAVGSRPDTSMRASPSSVTRPWTNAAADRVAHRIFPDSGVRLDQRRRRDQPCA